MNEFIEKLIGRLEETRKTALNKVKFPIMIVCKHDLQEFADICFEESKKIVNQLAEEYNNGWIPVSERLPEDGGYYLVVYHDWSDGNYLPKYDDVRVKVMHYQVKDLATGYSGWNYPRTIGENADLIEADQHREVTHWKSLPGLPYQPKGE